MSPDFYDLAPEDRVIVFVGIEELQEAESLVRFCEHCGRRIAKLPFEMIVDILAECELAVTDYVLEMPTTCCRCGHEIQEKTRVAV